jgi:hypothetical protein
LRGRKGQAIGIVLLTLALIFLFVGTVMPYYKSPQRIQGSGPGIKFSSSLPYWIDTYFIPPIDAGSAINLSVLSDRAGATTVLLASYDEDRQTIIGPPLVNVVFGASEKGLVVFTNSSRSGPYLLRITSYNSSYTFYLSSVWSRFYALRTMTIYGLGLLPLGAVIFYYYRIVEGREKMVEKALKGIKKVRQP